MFFRKCYPVIAGIALALILPVAISQASTDVPLDANTVLHLAPERTFVVTSTADSGDNNHPTAGSFRAALVNANKSQGHDSIVFDLPGSGVKTFTIVNYLPDVSDNAGVTIDGTTSDDRIEFNGVNVCGHHGLRITGNNNVVKGLIINRVNCAGGGSAISIEGGSNNVIIGNYLGTDPSGNAARPNLAGVMLINAHNNTIGGTNGVTPGGACTGDCNLLSGNVYHGVVLDRSNGNKILGNYMGVNVSGMGALSNHSNGVLLGDSSNNIVGGTSPEARNVISSNTLLNVEVALSNSHDNLVQGNWIGLNSKGTGEITGTETAVEVDLDAYNNKIDSNVISASSKFGVLVFLRAHNTTITNNRVGISATGDAQFGNDFGGIEVQTNNNSIVGNRVAFSGKHGIRVKEGVSNLVSRNEVFANGTFGIALGTDAFTDNDPGDGDTGPNNLQNFPNITSANRSGSTVNVSGNLNSKPNGSYTLEFFYNPVCDVSFDHAVGEGQVYLGTTKVNTDGGGNTGFSIPLANVPPNGVITATATDSANNTSEFSYCRGITDQQQQPTPAKPQLLSPSNNQNVTKNPPTLDWAATANTTSYRVVIREGDKHGPKVKVEQMTSDQYTPPALQGGKTYFWRVFACNAAGCAKSGFYSFTIQ